jgi:hypothetical protein
MISIKNDFPADYTTRAAGEKLRKQILEANTPLTIDFTDIVIASASFFDEGMAKLIDEGWVKADLERDLVLKNIFRRDLKLLIDTCSLRGVSDIKFNSI